MVDTCDALNYALVTMRWLYFSSCFSLLFRYKKKEMISKYSVSFFILITKLIYAYTNETHTTKLENKTFNFTDPCKTKTEVKNYVFAFYCVFVITVGVLGNIIAIAVILLSRHLRSQIAYHFLISLATADIGVSAFVTTLKVQMYLQNNSFCLGEHLCKLLTYADILFPSASILHLMVIGVDRCIAINSPFFYTSHFSKAIAKIVIMCTWFYVILWSSLGMFPWDSQTKPIHILRLGRGIFCINANKYYFTTFSIVIYMIPMIITIILYLLILDTAKKQNKKTKKLCLSDFDRKGKKKPHCLWKKDIKATKTVFIVFTAFTICFLPHFTIIILQYWTDIITIFYHLNPLAYDVVTTIFNTVLPVLNSCINPFIYFIFGSQFRIALKNLIYKVLGKPRNGILFPDQSMAASNTSIASQFKKRKYSNSSSLKRINSVASNSLNPVECSNNTKL